MLPGIGIFGTSNIVTIIVQFLKEKGFKIEALWGRTLSKAEETAKSLAIPYYTNQIDNVLLRKDVDLIFIMCSPNLQAQIAVKALGIGKHVVCDKPAGLGQDEAIKMVHAAQYYPSLISIVNHSLRYLPIFARMRQAIKDNFIGAENEIKVCDIRVYMDYLHFSHYNWRCDKTMGGGVLSLVGGHYIDLISYLIGQKAVRVHGIVRTNHKTTSRVNGIRQITSPDYCSFQMEMSGKALVTFSLHCLPERAYSHEVLICGKDGDLVSRNQELMGYKTGSAREESNELITYSDEEKVETIESSSQYNMGNTIPEPYVRGFHKMIGSLKEAFLPVEDKNGWVKEPVADASTFEDGLYVQAVIDALYKSSSRREWVRVDVITEEPDPNPLLSAAVRRTGISL